MPTRTDDELMVDFQNDDESAFNVLVARYYDTVQGWLLHWSGGDWHLSQDLVQETFLRLSTKRHLYRGDGTFRGFLFTLARRHAMNVLRRQHRDTASEFFYSESREPDPSDAAAMREEAELLGVAMDDLTDIDRESLSLWMDGESTEDIADLCCVPAGTVKSRVNRAKRQIRNGLARFADVA